MKGRPERIFWGMINAAGESLGVGVQTCRFCVPQIQRAATASCDVPVRQMILLQSWDIPACVKLRDRRGQSTDPHQEAPRPGPASPGRCRERATTAFEEAGRCRSPRSIAVQSDILGTCRP